MLRLTPVVFIAALAAFAQAQDVPSLEAKAKDLYQKKAYVRPPGENVVDVCKEIIKLDPTNAAATDLLTKVTGILVSGGDAQLKKRNYKGALDSFDQALALDSSNERARAGKEKARQGLERDKFEVEPGKTPEFYMAKGNELFDHGDYVRARKYYVAILKSIPDDPFAKSRERECAEKLGAAAAGASAPQDPAKRLVYYREAAAQLEKSGDFTAALSYWKQIAAAAPDDAAAKAGVERCEDQAMGNGRVKLTLSGAPFWWSSKVKDAEEAKDELAITVKVLVDGKEAATFTDSVIEELKLGDVSRNDLAFPPEFSARVPNPGNNTIAVQIQAGASKPRIFGGQATLALTKGKVLAATVVGTSDLKYGGTFGKKMSGDYTITVKPAGP